MGIGPSLIDAKPLQTAKVMPNEPVFLTRSRTSGVLGIRLPALEDMIDRDQHGMRDCNDGGTPADFRCAAAEAGLKSRAYCSQDKHPPRKPIFQVLQRAPW